MPTTQANTSAAANATCTSGNGAAGNDTSGNGAAGNGAAGNRTTRCKLQVFENGAPIGFKRFESDLIFDATNVSLIEDVKPPRIRRPLSPFPLPRKQPL